MNKIAIIGSGGLGRETLAMIRQINSVTPAWEVVGFFDDNMPKGSTVNKMPVLGKVEDITASDNVYVVMAVGTPVHKEAISKRINPSARFATLIHPTAVVADPEYVSIGEGCILTAGSRITTNIILGKHVLLNLNATVGHDSKIGDFCSVMPGANVAGYIEIGQSVLIGSCAAVINESKVGRGAKIGSGAVVISNIEEFATAVGVPARIVKK